MRTRFVQQQMEQGYTRRQARARFQQMNQNYQAHHLIPAAVAERSPLLHRLGFDTNEFANGILLPNRPGYRRARDLAAHNGRHERYDVAMEQVLARIDALARSGKGDVWAVSKVKELRKVLFDELTNSAGDVMKIYRREPREWIDILTERLELNP